MVKGLAVRKMFRSKSKERRQSAPSVETEPTCDDDSSGGNGEKKHSADVSQDLENHVNSTSFLNKKKHRVMNGNESCQSLPLEDLGQSMTSLDGGYNANSTLSRSLSRNLTKSPRSKSSSFKHKRVSIESTTDDADVNCLPLGGSNNSLDELFEQIYEMDSIVDDDDNTVPSSNTKPSHSDKEGSKRSVRSSRGEKDEKKEGSKRKSKKEGSSPSMAEKGSETKSTKPLMDTTTEDSKPESRSKSMGRSKSTGRSRKSLMDTTTEDSKRESRSKSTGRSKSRKSLMDTTTEDSKREPRSKSTGRSKSEKGEPKKKKAEKEGFKRKSRKVANGDSINNLGSLHVGEESANGDIADNNFEDSMTSLGSDEIHLGTRPLPSHIGKRKPSLKSLSFSLPNINHNPDEVDDDDDVKSQPSQVEKPRKSKGRSKSPHKRKSSKSLIVEGSNQEVEQLNQELSEARRTADDFAKKQKDQEIRIKSMKKELQLLKLEQVEAEETKQEHERVLELLPEAIRYAEENENALQEERAKLSQVTSALTILKLEHQNAKEAAEEVEQLREQLSASKQESEERAGTQKEERSALAGLVTELTQLKMENERAEAAPDSEEVEKLRDQLSEALNKVEEIEKTRTEDHMRVNDVRISALEEALENKDLVILEAKGIVEALDSALRAANQRSLSQGSEDFQENASVDSSMKESYLQVPSSQSVSSGGERKSVGLEKQWMRPLERTSSSESADLMREEDTALKERLRRLESTSSSERQKSQIEIQMYKKQVKVAKRDNEDAQEQIKLLEDLVDNFSSSHGGYGSDGSADRAELDEAHAQLKLLGKQIQSLRAMNENLEDNEREELARRVLVETRLDELENDRISIAAELSEERTVNERNSSELRDAKRHIMVLEDEIDAFHTAEDQQFEETERANRENERTKEEVDRLKRDHDDVAQSHQKELDASKMETESAQSSLETLKAEIKSSCETHEKSEERLAQENENLHKALEDLEQKHNSQVVTIRNELEYSRTELASTTTELMEAQLRVRAVKRNVEEYEARNQKLEQEKEKLAKAELQGEGLEEDSAEAAAAYRAESEKKIMSLETMVLDLESAREEAQQAITDLEERRSQEKSTYHQEVTRLAEGWQQLAKSEEQVEVMRESLSKSQIREAELSKEIEEARIVARDLEDGSQTKKELTELSNSNKASILLLTNELSDVKEQLSERTSTADDASSRVKTLESEIAVASSTKAQIGQQLEEETAKYKAKMVQLETNLEAREHALGGEIEILKDKANTLVNELDQANIKKTALELELYELTSRDKDQKKSMTDDFQLQIEGLKTDFNIRETSLTKELSESNAETSAEKELLNEAQLDVRRLETEAKTALESLEQLNDSRDSEMKTLQTRLSALQQDRGATEVALRRELGALKYHSELADTDLECAGSKITELQEAIVELEAAHNDVEALAMRLKDEVSKWEAEATEWYAEATEWKEKAENLAPESAPGQSDILKTAVVDSQVDSQRWGRLGSIFKKGPIEENNNTPQIQDILDKNTSLEARLAEFAKQIEKLEGENANYSLSVNALSV